MNERGGICSVDQKYNVLQKEDGDGLTAGCGRCMVLERLGAD